MDHRVSKDMISSGMSYSGSQSKEDLGRTQYGAAARPDALMNAYQAMYPQQPEQLDEGYKEIDRKKENKMYARAGNLARTALSSKGKKKEEAQKKSSNIVSAITKQKENKRFDEIGKSPKHNEEADLFDIIKGRLIDEGYSEEEAIRIMVNMGEGIIEAYGDANPSIGGRPVMTGGKPMSMNQAEIKGLERLNKMKRENPKEYNKVQDKMELNLKKY